MKIREKVKEIRKAQQQDLRDRQELGHFEINKLEVGNLMNKDEEEDKGEFLSEEGFQALQETLSDQRNQEILKLVNSIQSLNTIYKEFQDLVIEQGTILDRIDYNIEATAQNVEVANEHLTKVTNPLRRPRNTSAVLWPNGSSSFSCCSLLSAPSSWLSAELPHLI
jgi:syntaxin 16